MAQLTGDLAAVEPAAIELVLDNDAARLDVPKRVAVRSKLLRGSTKRPITIGDGRLATLLGTPGVAGKSSRYRLTIDAARIDLAVEGRSTTSGRFSYSHKDLAGVSEAARAPRSQAPWATFGLAAAAALTIVAVGASPYARYLHHEYQPASATGQAGAVALFLSGWALMLLAMMLPTATTLLAAVGRLGHDRVAGRRLQLFAGAGFLSTWIFVGYAFRVGDLLGALDRGLGRLAGGPTSPRGRRDAPRRRRLPVHFAQAPLPHGLPHAHGIRLPAQARRPRRSRCRAHRRGVRASCVGCCWALMLVLFGVGLGNVAWMFAIGAVMAVEKNTAIGPRVGAPVGALLIAAAAGVALFG